MIVRESIAEIRARSIYKSICQPCVWRTHPMMLTGYCLRSEKCDLCGRYSDLSMVSFPRRTVK